MFDYLYFLNIMAAYKAYYHFFEFLQSQSEKMHFKRPKMILQPKLFFKETYEFLKKMMIQKGFWKHLTFPYKVTCIIQAKKFLIIVFLVRIAQLTIGLLHWIYLVGALDKSYGQNSSTHGLKALKKARPFIVLPVSCSASDDL